MASRKNVSGTPRLSSVPTSNSPPIPEWAGAYWYVLRCGALQAGADKVGAAAEDLVAWFKGFEHTTPCPECRAHYKKDWETTPFTTAHAASPLEAMRWVEDLRMRIETRNAAAGKGKSAAGKELLAPPAAPATLKPSAPLQTAFPVVRSRPGTTAAPGLRQSGRRPGSGPVQAQVRSQQSEGTHALPVPGPSIPSDKSGGGVVTVPMKERPVHPLQRKVAILSALKATAANQAGVKGCNCGGRLRKEPAVVDVAETKGADA
jgi:hypothetical protein